MKIRLGQFTCWSAALALFFVPLAIFSLALRFQSPGIVILPFGALQKTTGIEKFVSVRFRNLQRLVFGPAKAVTIQATFLRLTNVSSWRFSPEIDPSFLTTNGLKIWVVSDADIHNFQNQIQEQRGVEVIARPSFRNQEGTEGSMSISKPVPMNGTNCNVGIKMDVMLSSVRSDSTHVILSVLSTELAMVMSPQKPLESPRASIQTNLALTLQLRIPKSMGALILQDEKNVQKTKAIGVVLSVGGISFSKPDHQIH